MHDRTRQAAQRAGCLGGVGIVGIGAGADGGEKLSEVWRNDRIRASGATPTNAFVGAGRPAMTAAVRVPCASQSDMPFPAWSTKSPPGFSTGTRGEPFTPVSMTATVTPDTVSNFCAWAKPKVIARPWPVREVRVGEDRRRRADTALFHGLVRPGLIWRYRRRIDDRRFDRSDGRSRQQHEAQCGDQRTNSAHATSPPEKPHQRTVCWQPDSKLIDRIGAAQKVRSRLRVEGTRQC